MAVEEAFLAEQGFTEKLMADIKAAVGSIGCDDDPTLKSFQEATGSNRFARHRFLNQVSQLQSAPFLLPHPIGGKVLLHHI